MNKIIYIFILSLIFSFNPAQAYTLSKVSPVNPKILVILGSGEEAQTGDIFRIYDGEKFVTQVKVSMVRDNKFVARYMNGTAVQSIKSFPNLTFKKLENTAFTSSKIRLSFNLVTAMNQITVTQTNPLTSTKESVAMAGSDFGFELSGDYKLNSKWGLFASLGYESFKVAGQASAPVCSGSATRDCYVDLKYMTGAAGLKYYMDKSYGTYWLGVGAKLKSPISKASNSINEVDLTYAHGVLLQGGLDYKTKSSFYIPASLYYNYSLNTSDTVTQIQNMGFTIGIGKSF